MAYEISGTSTPSKVPYKWGLLKNNMKVTARLQPKVTASPCSFSPIDGLTKIEVCDQITDPDTGRVWDYCKVGDKYGFILYTSIRDYLRTPGQSIEKVARWVIANDFSTNETRSIFGNPVWTGGTDDGSGVPFTFIDYTVYGAWSGGLNIPNAESFNYFKIERLVTE